MNKFKAWLIHKLGGYVYLCESTKIVFKTVPSVTFECLIALPPVEFGFEENEINEIVARDAAEKIGNFIVSNHLYDVETTNHFVYDHKVLKYTVRVIESTQGETHGTTNGQENGGGSETQC